MYIILLSHVMFKLLKVDSGRESDLSVPDSSMFALNVLGLETSFSS